MRPIGIGFGNIVIDERIIGIIGPDTNSKQKIKRRGKSTT